MAQSDSEAQAWFARAAQRGYRPAREPAAMAANGTAHFDSNADIQADFKGP